MIARFADSSFLIALLSEKDVLHREADAFLAGLYYPLITTEWVLAEVVDALSQPQVRSRLRPFYDFLTDHPLVTIIWATHSQFEKGLDLFDARRDKSWSLTDCISFEVMKEQGLSEALTCDHHFEQAGFKALLGE